MALTKEEQKMYPKTMVAKQCNEMYATETLVNNRIEENRWYEMLNHEANMVIEIKLPNKVIK